MANHVKCARCKWTSKQGFLSSFEGWPCPNCENEAISWKKDRNFSDFSVNYQCFYCSACGEHWKTIPCPDCGTGINGLAGCYVATCVYGSYNCPEVRILRRYRDEVLMKSSFGRGFIKIYYATSPKIVEVFGNRKWFHKICKPCVNALVKRVKAKEKK